MITRLAGVLASLVLLSAGAPAKRHTVEISQFRFKPAVIHVSAGDTIVWKNDDIVPHTASANDHSWDSGNIAAKAQQITVARKKGEHEFTCLYHSNMKGKLVVE